LPVVARGLDTEFALEERGDGVEAFSNARWAPSLKLSFHAEPQSIFVLCIQNLDLVDHDGRFCPPPACKEVLRPNLQSRDANRRPPSTLIREPLIKLWSYVVEVFKRLFASAGPVVGVFDDLTPRNPDVLAIAEEDLMR
jgi:hypothetical protein